MRPERRQHLERNGGKLTDEEFAAGWHYCHDWDGMLIHPSDPEAECCTCVTTTAVPKDEYFRGGDDE